MLALLGKIATPQRSNRRDFCTMPLRTLNEEEKVSASWTYRATEKLHGSARMPEADTIAVYRRIDEYNGQLDCLLMKSRLARWSGDEVTAEHADGMYFQLMGDHDKQER